MLSAWIWISRPARLLAMLMTSISEALAPPPTLTMPVSMGAPAAAMVAATASSMYVKSRRWCPSPYRRSGCPVIAAWRARWVNMSGRWRGP
ncbi:hypothetical protein SNA_13655 [Streptomyces natalensis ATCC 27448]|uniref:Secreted protein n=1 Tax=Streptomyces natalensis ATCC 27448 TaxID=1240678 RepID=A0A0D7CNU1_9ACTN|nr:hypothetical protein SNA_13655 [Streptomyces natalensis ATCC 27448]